MAGRKKTPCDFCENENWYTDEGVAGHQLTVEIYPENNFIYITSFAPDETGESQELEAEIEMNYCPKCGRKLC